MRVRPENKFALSADQVFVLTDGNLRDAPIDVSFYAKRGIQPIGLYVGRGNRAASMGKHFRAWIVRQSVEELAEALLQGGRKVA